jgi:parallel beta-helix repeat protein
MGVNVSRSVALLLVLVFLTTSCIFSPLPVDAVSKTIVVPDDYPTITSAIGNATVGDTIFVKKGIYEGPINQTLVIDKSLSLIGEDANNTILNLHPAYTEWWILTQQFFNHSDAIVIDANDVTLSNFTIIPSPGGDVSATGDKIRITGNIIGNSRDTSLSVSGSYNVISGNSVFQYIHLDDVNSSIIIDNTCFSLRLGFSRLCSDNIISGNKIEGPGSYGIHIKASTHNVFYGNYITNLHGWGEGDSIGGVGVTFEYGGMAENNTFYHNVFMNNNRNVAFEENVKAIGNFWDNGEEGNYWDDYNGTDGNRNGIGDTPYVINEDNIDNYPLVFPYDVENDAVGLPPPEPFPTMLVVAVATAVIIAVGLLVFFRRRKRLAESDLVKNS